MTEYVIDENVIRNAWHGKKADGSDAFEEMKFLADLFSCNGHLNLSEKIRKKFNKFRKGTENNTKGVNDLMLSKFIKLMYNQSKCLVTEPIKTDFQGVKKCDNEFVGVALKTNSVLVTADEKLKAAIEKDKIAKKIRCVTVEETLEDINSNNKD